MNTNVILTLALIGWFVFIFIVFVICIKFQHKKLPRISNESFIYWTETIQKHNKYKQSKNHKQLMSDETYFYWFMKAQAKGVLK